MTDQPEPCPTCGGARWLPVPPDDLEPCLDCPDLQRPGEPIPVFDWGAL